MKLIVTTALAVLMACPAYAHSETTMNEDNPLFEACVDLGDATICDIRREHMVCEPGADYDKNWAVFVEKKGLPRPENYSRILHVAYGPLSYMTFRLDEHYRHTYIHIELENVFCMAAITHYDLGEPA